MLLGNGDGTFRPARTFPGNGFNGVYAADLNHDAIPDVVLGGLDGNEGTVGVALGNGDGTFGPQTTYSIGSYTHILAVGDFNGDGTVDIAAPDSLANNIHILSGNGDGTFDLSPISFQTTGSPRSIVAGDLLDNGKVDLVVSVSPGIDLLYNSAQ